MSVSRQIFAADPGAAFLANEDAIRAAIERVLTSGTYILGAEVERFESEFADYLGGGFAVGVANGTDALELALRAAGVQSGDLVATVANTVSATAAAINRAGARPIYIEIDEATMLMSPDALASEFARGFRIAAVLPVHLYGNPAEMPRIMEVCAANGAIAIEDCAQAHGAKINGRNAGTFGQAAAFSFYPTKNLGALGDGGAVFTTDMALRDEVRLLRQYGWRTRYVSEIPGCNSRLDEIQAAVLSAKLPALEASNNKRGLIAQRYASRLAGQGLALPVVAEASEAVWHQYAIRTTDRDVLRRKLESAGIFSSVLYPVPLHHQPAYLDESVSLPITERACREVLSLPCHPGLDLDDVDRVCEVILQ